MDEILNHARLTWGKHSLDVCYINLETLEKYSPEYNTNATQKDNCTESPSKASAGSPCTQRGYRATALSKFINSKDSWSICP